MGNIIDQIFSAPYPRVFFILFLACLFTVVLGGIPGKLELRGFPRLAVAFLSVAFLAATFISARINQFQIIEATIAFGQPIYGDFDTPCPIKVSLTAVISVANPPGSVAYEIDYSDGQQHPDTTYFDPNISSVRVNDNFSVDHIDASGGAILTFLNPPFAQQHSKQRIQVSCASKQKQPTSAPPATNEPNVPVNSPTGQKSPFDGHWVEVNPKFPDHPIRFNITQQGNQLVGLPSPFQLKDDEAIYQEIQGCAERFRRPGFDYNKDPSTVTLTLRPQGQKLIYTAEAKWNTPCDGHEQGTENKSVYELQRVQG
jgi:hypothetical protein